MGGRLTVGEFRFVENHLWVMESGEEEVEESALVLVQNLRSVNRFSLSKPGAITSYRDRCDDGG